MRFCRNARGLLPFFAVLSFSCVFRGTLTQSAMSARLICARVALPAALFTVRVCAAVCLFCALGFARLVRRFARYVRRFARLARAVCTVCAAVCAFTSRCQTARRRVLFVRRYACSARSVLRGLCGLCARPCALRVYFKVSNSSTARFVVTVSAPPLSGSASPALSTSSPKGSPPAVRSSFI